MIIELEKSQKVTPFCFANFLMIKVLFNFTVLIKYGFFMLIDANLILLILFIGDDNKKLLLVDGITVSSKELFFELNQKYYNSHCSLY